MAIIVAGDTEMYGISNNFICGTWCLRNDKGFIEYYTFTDKEKYENWLIEFAKKQKTWVHVYFHNLGYDFFRYADLSGKLSGRSRTDGKKGKIIEGYKPVSLSRMPMIDYVDNNGRVLIRFMDTFRLINKSLKEIGEKLGYEKGEPNEKLQAKYKQEKVIPLTEAEMQEMIQYNQKDTEICLHIVEFIRNQTDRIGYKPRQLITIGKLAIDLFNRRLRELNMKWIMFRWKDEPDERYKCDEYILTKYPEEIREAYKTGRIEALQTGQFEGCTNIDYNSLFPKAMIEMPFPNIKKETKIDKPLEVMSQETILNSIGVCKCILQCPKQEIGYLPIRIKFGTKGKNSVENLIIGEDIIETQRDYGTYIEETIFPNHECKLEGTWTNYELLKAVERGYNIESIEYVIMYKPILDAESPLKQFLIECYEKRKEGELENFFYKYIMNNLHGKFAQRIYEGKYEVGDVSDADKYVENGYKIKTKFVKHNKENGEIESINYLYTKDTDIKYARTFAPILSAYTTAYAREIMYKDMEKIKAKDIIYIGTDSILFKGDYLDKFEIGKEIGQYKIIAKGEEKMKNVDARIWGKNNYRVGNDIRISGINKIITGEMEKNDFEKPFEYWKFPTIDSVDGIENMFVRKYEEKDLSRVQDKTEGLKEYIKGIEYIIDSQTKYNKDAQERESE